MTGHFNSNNLRTKAAGIVSRVGSAVTSFTVGDRVFGLVPGNIGTHTRSKASLVQKITPGKSLVDAVTMSVVYLTAIYALRHLARLKKGDTILIQLAIGRLGLAALCLAQDVGTTVYATVRNNQKHALLERVFGIPGS